MPMPIIIPIVAKNIPEARITVSANENPDKLWSYNTNGVLG